jgi:hypothetical protein
MVKRRARDEEDDEEELEDTDDEEDEDDEEDDDEEDEDRAKLREIHGWLSELMSDGKRRRPARSERRDSGRRRKTKVKVKESKTPPRNVKTLRRLFRRSG